MRNRDPHRENVGNILAICLPIVTMQHIRESPSASHAMRISAWNAWNTVHDLCVFVSNQETFVIKSCAQQFQGLLIHSIVGAESLSL